MCIDDDVRHVAVIVEFEEEVGDIVSWGDGAEDVNEPFEDVLVVNGEEVVDFEVDLETAEGGEVEEVDLVDVGGY